MITLVSGRRRRLCDGLARRNFLKIGALAWAVQPSWPVAASVFASRRGARQIEQSIDHYGLPYRCVHRLKTCTT